MTGFPLHGAEFTLTNTQTGAVMNAISDAHGLAVFSPIQPGTYFLTEIRSPARYQLHPNVYIITVENNGNVLVDGHPSGGSLNIPNTPELTPGSLTISKVARDTELPLPGAEFTLTNNQTGAATTAVTDSHGFAYFNAIQPGAYRLEETRPAAGYEPNPGYHTVTVENNGTVLVNGYPSNQLSFSNVPTQRTGALTIHKTDNTTGLPLPGAEFTLINTVTGASMAAVSDVHGLAVFAAIPPGAYHLVETQIPEGYEPLLITVTVTVENNGTVFINGSPANDFYIGNVPISAPGSLRIRKYDTTTGQPLYGAEYTLTNNQTSETIIAVTDEHGYANFGSIPPGTYHLAETQAPAGFEPNPTTYAVTVENNGTVLVNGSPSNDIVVYNAPFLFVIS